MLNVGTVKFKLSSGMMKKLKELDKFVMEQAFAFKLGTLIVDGSKKSIANGISPVRGVGRFEGYKDPVKYPGDLKASRPVNLYLTGEMVNSLNFRKEGEKLLVGIFDDEVSEKLMARVDTHNRGTHKHVPRRQFIPAKGQEYIVSIQSQIKKLYRERISEVLARLLK